MIPYKTSPSTEHLDRTNVVYMFKFPLENCDTKENSAYVGLTNRNSFETDLQCTLMILTS